MDLLTIIKYVYAGISKEPLFIFTLQLLVKILSDLFFRYRQILFGIIFESAGKYLSDFLLESLYKQISGRFITIFLIKFMSILYVSL